MMNFSRLFKKVIAPEIQQTHVDVQALDRSFHLLQSTTAEVSTAAIEAAKVLQERLDDSEERFYHTIDSMEDFVLIKDNEGRWKTLNKFGQHLMNMHHGEYIGKTDKQLAKEFPHLAEMLDFCRLTDKEAWAAQSSSRSEEKIPHAGGYYYIDMIKTPTYESDGSRKELVVVGRDVTEIHIKHRREKACFLALNSASDAIAIIDRDARLFFCNDQFVQTFDFNSYQDIVDESLIDILPFIPQYEEMWKFVQGNRTWSMKCPTTGTTLTVLPVMNGQPSPIYYICTFKTDHHCEHHAVCEKTCDTSFECSLKQQTDK